MIVVRRVSVITTRSKPWVGRCWPRPVRQPQRAARHGRRVHHTQGIGVGQGPCGHRWGQPVAHVGGDPSSIRGSQLLGGVRRPHRLPVISRAQPAAGLWRPTDRAVCPRSPGSPGPAAPHRPITARPTTTTAGPPTVQPTSTNCHWPAAPTTAWSKKPAGGTRKRKDGRTVWSPPAHLDTGQARVND